VKIILISLILICETLAGSIAFSAEEVNFVEPVGGFDFDFSQGPPQVHDVWFAENHYTAEEWKSAAIAGYANPFVEEVTLKPLVKNGNSHIIAMKTAFVIRKPITFITREKYLSPDFHIKTNPSIEEMKVISQVPLIFDTKTGIFGFMELNSLVHFLYFDENEIQARPNLQQITRYHGLTKVPPKFLIYRYAEKFNRILELAVTTSEFYPIDANSTLVLSFAFVSANGSWFTGFSGAFAKRKLRNAFEQIIRDNIHAIDNLP